MQFRPILGNKYERRGKSRKYKEETFLGGPKPMIFTGVSNPLRLKEIVKDFKHQSKAEIYPKQSFHQRGNKFENILSDNSANVRKQKQCAGTNKSCVVFGGVNVEKGAEAMNEEENKQKKLKFLLGNVSNARREAWGVRDEGREDKDTVNREGKIQTNIQINNTNINEVPRRNNNNNNNNNILMQLSHFNPREGRISGTQQKPSVIPEYSNSRIYKRNIRPQVDEYIRRSNDSLRELTKRYSQGSSFRTLEEGWTTTAGRRTIDSESHALSVPPKSTLRSRPQTHQHPRVLGNGNSSNHKKVLAQSALSDPQIMISVSMPDHHFSLNAASMPTTPPSNNIITPTALLGERGRYPRGSNPSWSRESHPKPKTRIGRGGFRTHGFKGFAVPPPHINDFGLTLEGSFPTTTKSIYTIYIYIYIYRPKPPTQNQTKCFPRGSRL